MNAFNRVPGRCVGEQQLEGQAGQRVLKHDDVTYRSWGRAPRLIAASAVVAATLYIAGCSTVPTSEPDAETEPAQAPVVVETAAPEPAEDRPDDLHYNLSKLDDPEFTQVYGDGENPKIWYTAAENLGHIGKPAIPYLIEKLDSTNDHEVMLALYALQLASQDPQVQQHTDGNYVSLPSALNPRANRHNKAIALSWWHDYKHLWDAQ